jgi:ketosteroid isomerase-like protein
MTSDEQQNIKLLRSSYDAASRGNFGPFRDALDPDVEWIEPNVPGLWFSGTHRGAQAVWKDVVEPTVAKFDDFRVHVKRLYAVGDHIIAIGYFRGLAKTTGKNLNAATAHVCTMSHGKVVRFEAFHDSGNWLETLGLVHRELDRMAA